MTQNSPADPVTKVNRDLTEILELSAALTHQAIQLANDRLMPGGYAMVALASVASPTAHAEWVDDAEENAIAAALRAGLNPTKIERDIETDDDDWEPPLQTLRYWSDRWRKHWDTASPEHPTLETEANFIRWALGWAHTNEPNWNACAEDINTARRRLENLLHAGSRPDRTRVVCDRPTCTKNPRQLIRVRAPRAPAAWSCISCSTEVPLDHQGDHCPNPWCHTVAPPRPVWASDPAMDRWKCPACKARYDDKAYQEAHAKQLRSEGAAKFVVLSEAIATLKAQGRPEASVRQWLKVPEHKADQCTLCRAKYDPAEYAACPRHLKDKTTKQYRYDRDGEPILCGGDLRRVWSPSLDDITEGWCELGTRRRMIWWPDLWRLHLTTRTRNRGRLTA
ncbi:hypothetical protein EFK50_01130 [Nocardioides marmoriginsengisoli]|uniref:Uncharacterized protein n=1 Tax=Nocardioides marmoriginsengisoli TaxID=661483 RepID=A0A3N0CSB6_9ACTN|nr:hypothetical protein [Nocardioides marmoriginsengisoli]RNL66259.1 hypothetical protein EFK50_01130 [Nocardioides marmoriginsengisoli]